MLFAYPDRLIPSAVVTPVVSGGSWLSGLPLANLQDADLSKVARSTNLDSASTLVNIDLGTDRGIRVWSLLRHNLSLTATLRLTAWGESSHTTLLHDTGTIPAWLTFYPPDSLPWGHPDLWNGLINIEDRAGYMFDFIRAFSDQVIARYWQLVIVDTANPDGYVELGRCILAPAWEPPSDMNYGATVGWESNATTAQTRSGKRWIDETAQWRTATCTLAGMTPGQAMSCVLDMQRRLGKSGEALFVFDPTDEYQAMWQRSFLCTMVELSPIEYPYFDANTAAFKLQEVL